MKMIKSDLLESRRDTCTYKEMTTQQPSISDLIGTLKQQSDLVTRPMRVRYTDSLVVTPGTTFRQTLPRVADDCVDLRSLKIQFDLAITGDTKLSTYVDAPCVQAIFNRVRVVSGSTVVADILENPTSMPLCLLLDPE